MFGGEMALYFLVKTERGDLTYWVPLYGIPGTAVGFLHVFS